MRLAMDASVRASKRARVNRGVLRRLPKTEAAEIMDIIVSSLVETPTGAHAFLRHR